MSLAVCFALMPFAVEAAGLGKLTVISGLGEPLNAEIELLATGPEELSSLSAAIAPDEAYAVQGIERTALQKAIKLEVKKKPDGTALLKLSSSQPITDPFLDMLIQVDWSTGRLLREYTLLLDPPGYAQAPTTSPIANPTSISSQPLAAPAAPAMVDEKKSNGVTAPSKKSKAPLAPVAAKPEATENETHTTVKGDTLIALAREAQPEGVSLEQVLAGLYQANKGAFVDGNMNRLKVGQIIKVPSAEQLGAVPKAEAAKQVRVHSADWNAYRNKLAGAVAEAPAAREDAGNKAASSGKITTAAEDKAAPAPAGPRDVVKLSKNDSAATKNLQDKLNNLQEEAIAREKSVKEANERTAALEKQVADMQKLLAIKNQAMAELQKNAATPPAPEVKAPPVAPVEPPKQVAPEPAKPEVTIAPEVPPAPAESAAPETPKTPEPAKPEQEKKVPAKKVVVPEPVVSEPSLLDDIDPVVVGGGLGALLLLAGGWFFLRNKRRRSLDGFEKDILTSGGLKANTVFGNTLGGGVDGGDTSFLADFSQSSGMIDTHDVDPIAEAEVYMAYGRDAQAEEILKDAITKDPQRYELHLKLLEMYAARKDSSAFEAVAGELYSTLGSADPTWAKVAVLGRQIEPNNPLYQVDESAIDASPFASDLDASDFGAAEKLDVDELAVEQSVPEDIGAIEDITAEEPLETSLDFSLGDDTEATSTTASPEEESLDFDIGGALATEGATEPEGLIDLGATESKDEAAELDFQLDFPSDTPASLPEEATEDTIQLDLSDFSTPTSESVALPDLAVTEPKEAAAEFDEIASFDVEALPELSTENPATEKPEEEISFDFPEMQVSELEIPEVDAPKASESPKVSEPIVAPIIADETIELSLPEFDKTTIMHASTDNEIVFESNPADSAAFDLDLDVDFGSLEAETKEPAVTQDVVAEDNSLPEIDLSGITLDLDPATSEEVDSVSSESSEVDTKLDLVTAYMDMGDNEGARELLEEVLKEGGEQQRARAEEILKTLG
ncbi:hypothetical protein A7981_05195 [Methylovorus sp. MM2]|nr:hypothetical protein A7981_05195 [Methylovorus sp. MM2]